jgi:hypothetical protein
VEHQAKGGTLERQKLLLALYAAGVALHRAVGADDAVAGADDRQRVRADRGAQGLGPVARQAEVPGELAVRGGRAVRDRVQGPPDHVLEFGSARVKLEVEGGQLTREVRGELPDHLGERGRCRTPARGYDRRVPLACHRHPGQRQPCGFPAGQKQLTYRAWHRRVHVHFFDSPDLSASSSLTSLGTQPGYSWRVSDIQPDS